MPKDLVVCVDHTSGLECTSILTSDDRTRWFMEHLHIVGRRFGTWDFVSRLHLGNWIASQFLKSQIHIHSYFRIQKFCCCVLVWLQPQGSRMLGLSLAHICQVLTTSRSIMSIKRRLFICQQTSLGFQG